MTVVFFNFSDGANPHRSVRFSSRAVRVFPALSLDAYVPLTCFVLLFSYGFANETVRGTIRSYDKTE